MGQVRDSFTYSDGNLVGNGGWVAGPFSLASLQVDGNRLKFNASSTAANKTIPGINWAAQPWEVRLNIDVSSLGGSCGIQIEFGDRENGEYISADFSVFESVGVQYTNPDHMGFKISTNHGVNEYYDSNSYILADGTLVISHDGGGGLSFKYLVEGIGYIFNFSVGFDNSGNTIAPTFGIRSYINGTWYGDNLQIQTNTVPAGFPEKVVVLIDGTPRTLTWAPTSGGWGGWTWTGGDDSIYIYPPGTDVFDHSDDYLINIRGTLMSEGNVSHILLWDSEDAAPSLDGSSWLDDSLSEITIEETVTFAAYPILSIAFSANPLIVGEHGTVTVTSSVPFNGSSNVTVGWDNSVIVAVLDESNCHLDNSDDVTLYVTPDADETSFSFDIVASSGASVHFNTNNSGGADDDSDDLLTGNLPDAVTDVTVYTLLSTGVLFVVNDPPMNADNFRFSLDGSSIGLADAPPIFPYYPISAGAHTVTLTSINAFGESADFDTPFTFSGAALEVPTGLTIISGDSQLEVSWDILGDGLLDYEVYQSDTEMGSYTLVDTSDNYGLTIGELTNGQEYWIKIRAKSIEDTPIFSDYTDAIAATPNIPVTVTSSEIQADGKTIVLTLNKACNAGSGHVSCAADESSVPIRFINGSQGRHIVPWFAELDWEIEQDSTQLVITLNYYTVMATTDANQDNYSVEWTTGFDHTLSGNDGSTFAAGNSQPDNNSTVRQLPGTIAGLAVKVVGQGTTTIDYTISKDNLEVFRGDDYPYGNQVYASPIEYSSWLNSGWELYTWRDAEQGYITALQPLVVELYNGDTDDDYYAQSGDIITLDDEPGVTDWPTDGTFPSSADWSWTIYDSGDYNAVDNPFSELTFFVVAPSAPQLGSVGDFKGDISSDDATGGVDITMFDAANNRVVLQDNQQVFIDMLVLNVDSGQMIRITVPGSGDIATLFSEDFSSYDDGALQGQSPWTNSDHYDGDSPIIDSGECLLWTTDVRADCGADIPAVTGFDATLTWSLEVDFVAVSLPSSDMWFEFSLGGYDFATPSIWNYIEIESDGTLQYGEVGVRDGSGYPRGYQEGSLPITVGQTYTLKTTHDGSGTVALYLDDVLICSAHSDVWTTLTPDAHLGWDAEGSSGDDVGMIKFTAIRLMATPAPQTVFKGYINSGSIFIQQFPIPLQLPRGAKLTLRSQYTGIVDCQVHGNIR